MAYAAEVHAECLRLAVSMLKPGAPVCDIDCTVADLIRTLDCSASMKGFPFEGGNSFPDTICVTTVPWEHAPAGNRKIEAGKVYSLDLAVCYDGWHVDGALSCVPEGTEPDGYMQDVLATGARCLLAGIDCLYGGVAASEVSKKMKESLRNPDRWGKLQMVNDIGGHGIGRYLHEPPYIPNCSTYRWMPPNDSRISKGSTVAIEPVLHYSVTSTPNAHIHNVQFEHTVLVGETRAEIITCHM